MFNYSEKEIKLIKFFGLESLINTEVVPPILYRIMVEKAFAYNMMGVEVESLRRCYNALTSCSINRRTKEWDDLIEFKENWV